MSTGTRQEHTCTTTGRSRVPSTNKFVNGNAEGAAAFVKHILGEAFPVYWRMPISWASHVHEEREANGQAIAKNMLGGDGTDGHRPGDAESQLLFLRFSFSQVLFFSRADSSRSVPDQFPMQFPMQFPIWNRRRKCIMLSTHKRS